MLGVGVRQISSRGQSARPSPGTRKAALRCIIGPGLDPTRPDAKRRSVSGCPPQPGRRTRIISRSPPAAHCMIIAAHLADFRLL